MISCKPSTITDTLCHLRSPLSSTSTLCREVMCKYEYVMHI